MKRKKKKKNLDLFHLKDPQMRDSQRSRQMVLLMYSIRDMADGSGFTSPLQEI